MSSCYAYFCGGLKHWSWHDQGPLKKLLYRQIKKYSHEDPIIGQTMEVFVRKVGVSALFHHGPLVLDQMKELCLVLELTSQGEY